MSEGEYVTLAVHNEFAHRIEDENDRQNHRLNDLEATVKEISRLTVSVEKLAVSMSTMADELKRQGERLTAIEEKPAKRWDAVVSGIISGVIGILIGLISAGVIK
jgi:uncharacterized protein YoxC